MEDWNLIELDSNKGKKLLDIAAYRDWQAKQYEDIDPDEVEARERAYGEMRAEVKERYAQLKADIAALTILQTRRLFRYLEGESWAEIAQSENPQVSRYTVRDTLLAICNKWEWTIGQLRQARAIWQYGKLYLDDELG